jgi:hypothetical protein
VSCSGIPKVALDEETLSVVTRRVCIGLPREPIGGPLVELGQGERLLRRVERARRATGVCRLADRLKLRSRAAKELVELVYKCTRRLE